MHALNRPFALLALLFFMWGFITVNNDVLVNGFKSVFELSALERALTQQSFFGAFFLVSLTYFLYSCLTGKDPVSRIGYKKGMVVGLSVCALGCLLFYPAAKYGGYGSFLMALFVLASGVSVLQICANPYAAILGAPDGAGSRLNMAQGLNSLGTTIGPIVGFLLIYNWFSDGNPSVISIASTYVVYGFIFLILAYFTYRSAMPGFESTDHFVKGFGVLKNSGLLFGSVAIFFYVGSEVSLGTWLVEYLKSPDGGSLSEASATQMLAWFWGGLMIGRLVAARVYGRGSPVRKAVEAVLVGLIVPMLIYVVTSAEKGRDGFTWNFIPVSELAGYAVMVGLMLLAFGASRGRPALSLALFSLLNALIFTMIAAGVNIETTWLVVGSGLFFSVGWSNIFSIAIEGLGHYTAQGSALLVMAIAGGAVLPSVQAWVIDNAAVSCSFWVPVAGMIPVMLYGVFAAAKRPTKL